MRCFICLEDRGGMAFNKRRLSKDSKVIEDIVRTIEDKTLLIEDYSKSLFDDKAIKLKSVSSFEKSMGLVKYGENVFAELWDPYGKGFEEYVIYRWNRTYPFDLAFDHDLQADGFQLEMTYDFEGTSHEKITKEVWRKFHE